jgi:chitinase
MKQLTTIMLIALVCSFKGFSQPVVIAYYAGGAAEADNFAVEKLTHIIYSFCHLQGNRLHVSNANDTMTIQKLVFLKSRNPKLKILLSLGGWGGCKTCSPVFSSEAGRIEFAQSVKGLLDYFKGDGIDLDWEYPVIPGYPDHPYSPDDKANFTDLVMQLRKALGKKQEISFAAGGFTTFLQQSIEWKKVMAVADRVNLMTYDLVHGGSIVTGHHTPLYSTSFQKESVDNAIHYLDSIGIPRNKLVIGAGFYGRVFEVQSTDNDGLYQPATFKRGVPYKAFAANFSPDSGFVYHWDDVAKAPYLFNAKQKLFVTFDDTTSIRLKTEYVIAKKLNGIMFWQLAEDNYSNGLLNAIDKVRSK